MEVPFFDGLVLVLLQCAGCIFSQKIKKTTKTLCHCHCAWELLFCSTACFFPRCLLEMLFAEQLVLNVVKLYFLQRE